MKVFITRKIPNEGINYLKNNGYELDIYPHDKPIPKSILLKKIKDVDAIITLLTDQIDKDVISRMDKCKIIANYAVGYNNIDVKFANEKNIVVTNTPDVLTDATADLAMTLVLTCGRRVIEGEKLIREGKFTGWKPDLLLGIELKNKTFGILGAGRIGCATALRASAFGAKIIYYSRNKNDFLNKKLNAKKVSLNFLLKKSDIISVHLPLTDKTFHLLNSDNLSLVKPSAIIINTARGEIIDENALINLLKHKKIFAAGLDVFENEPNINKKLLKLKNVVLLPHLGSATLDTRNNMALLAAKNVHRVLNGKKALTRVKM